MPKPRTRLFLRWAVFLALFVLLARGALAADEVHWTYSGEDGPEHWGELSPDFALCASGSEQSPIAIASSSPLNASGLQFRYQASALHVVNNGHTIQANYDAGSTVAVDGESYSLLQLHFHNPSEHAVDGAITPMELHLVHANASGVLAVVGVFLVEGEENAALEPVLANMPAEEGESLAPDGVTIHAADMLPADTSYWRYDGSLTTPPCSEGVKWHVMATPVEVSAGQIAAYTRIFSGNARPVQPLNERRLIVVSAPSTMPTTGAANDGLLAILVVAGAASVPGAIAVFAACRRRTLHG